jgi:hypothetical protein
MKMVVLSPWVVRFLGIIAVGMVLLVAQNIVIIVGLNGDSETLNKTAATANGLMVDARSTGALDVVKHFSSVYQTKVVNTGELVRVGLLEMFALLREGVREANETGMLPRFFNDSSKFLAKWERFERRVDAFFANELD